MASEGKPQTETISCPCCRKTQFEAWAEENGYTAVKCSDCGLVYVNPRPAQSLIDEAVTTGVHRDVAHGRNVINRRIAQKVNRYQTLLRTLTPDAWNRSEPLSWLDVGAGYGEVVEAVTALAPSGSDVQGVEPMKPKVAYAKARGLRITEGYLSEIQGRFDFVSLINVFSHIPDFREFLQEVGGVLKDGGELLIETGNIGDLKSFREAPSELDLPDHLVFAGEKNIRHFLDEAGFSIVGIQRRRADGLSTFSKNVVKKLLGRNVNLRTPYTSNYRSLFVRASLRSATSNHYRTRIGA